MSEMALVVTLFTVSFSLLLIGMLTDSTNT